MAQVVTPGERPPDAQDDRPVPPTGGVPGDDPGDDGDGEAPWWHAPWRIAVLGLAVLLLGAAVGYAVTTLRDAPPSAGSVDVGFLQDMRLHHDQAVGMAMTFREKGTDQDPGLRITATEVLLGQQFEAGVMAQTLRSWGQPEANTSDTVMTWMSMPTPVERMPGMATQEQMRALVDATGPAADRLFAELLLAHHEGGAHMADYAAANASDDGVRALAAGMAKAQRGEIVELTQALAELSA